MSSANNGLIVIGENINTTRKIRATSPNIVKEDGKVGYAYSGLDGTRRLLDITDIFPEDPAELRTARIPLSARRSASRTWTPSVGRSSARSAPGRPSSTSASTNSRSTRRNATTTCVGW